MLAACKLFVDNLYQEVININCHWFQTFTNSVQDNNFSWIICFIFYFLKRTKPDVFFSIFLRFFCFFLFVFIWIGNNHNLNKLNHFNYCTHLKIRDLVRNTLFLRLKRTARNTEKNVVWIKEKYLKEYAMWVNVLLFVAVVVSGVA